MKMVYLTAVCVYSLMCVVTSSAACLKDLFCLRRISHLGSQGVEGGGSEGIRCETEPCDISQFTCQLSEI